MKKSLSTILTIGIFMLCFLIPPAMAADKADQEGPTVAKAEELVGKSQEVLQLELQVLQSQHQLRLTEISRLNTLKENIEYRIPIVQAELNRLTEIIKAKQAEIKGPEPQPKKQ